MAGYFGLVGHDFHGNRKGYFTCRNIGHGTHSFTSLLNEGMLRIFYARKKSDGFGRV
jgi:hypothetical protein